MNPIIRNILAVIAGAIVGGMVNMGLIMLGGQVIAPPAGVDVGDIESLKTSMHLFEPRHFIFPFFAHASGTLTGAFLASLLAVNHRMKIALGMGGFFLIGGIINVFILPAPTWFVLIDLSLAYLPMGWFGVRLTEHLHD